MPKSFRVTALALACAAGRLEAQQPASSPAQKLDTVRVEVASRAAPELAAAQRSVQVIERAEIERQAARSITDLLALAVGADVQSRSPAQADIAIRGSALGQVLVLVDGIRMNDLQTAHFDLDLALPLDAVERIEILRGAGATLYGPDAIGGVVNVVTRRDPSWRTARVHGGSFGTVGAGVAGATSVGGTTFRLAGDGERSAGHRPGTDYDVVQATLGADRLVAGGRLAADASFAAREFGAQDFYAPFPSYERTRTVTAALRHDGASIGGWKLSSALAGRHHTDDFILRRGDPAFYRNIHRGWQTLGEVGVRRRLRDAAMLSAGIELFDARLASSSLGDRRERRASLFTEATLGTLAGANLSAGARVDRSSRLGTFLSPAIGVSFPVAAHVRVRGSASRGLRAPSWTELHYRDPGNVADSTLAPERFWTAELGARLLPAWGSVDVAAFVRDAVDLVDWVRPSGAGTGVPWTTANLEHATYRGLELVIGAPDLLGVDWSLHATGIAFASGAPEGFDGKYALRPITRTLGVAASRELLPGLRARADARQVRRAGERSHLLGAARVTYDVGRMVLRVDATNLGDAEYLDASAKPVAGRAVVVGVVVR